MLTIKRRPYIIRSLRELFYICANPLQKLYWRMFRPYRPGAKMLIFFHGKLLLVRIGYAHKKWVLPGGGIERGELPIEAAIREAKEESGVTVTNPEYIGEKFYTNQYKKVTVFYFCAEVLNDDLIIDGQEIIDAAWFDMEALPSEISPRLLEEISLYTNWKSEKYHG